MQITDRLHPHLRRYRQEHEEAQRQIQRLVARGWQEGVLGVGAFRYSAWGNWYIGFLEPPYRTRIPSLSLGQWFPYVAAHERRHLWQIANIQRSAGYPRIQAVAGRRAMG